MRYTLTMGSRGVITLPIKLRRALGLDSGNVLIAEETPQGVLLRPAATIPIEIYSDDRIKEFDEGEAKLAKLMARKGLEVPKPD